MRARFLFWFRLYALAALGLSFVISNIFSEMNVRSDCRLLIHGKIEEARGQVEQASATRNSLEDSMKSYAITLALVTSQLLQSKPEILADPNGLEQLSKDLGLHEISVANSEGVVEFSHPKEYVGQTYDTTPDLKEFLQLLSDPKTPIVQNIRPSADDPRAKCMYAGVERFDKPGFVEIGLEGRQLDEKILHLGQVENFLPKETASLYRGGLFGVFVDRNGSYQLLAGSRELLEGLNLEELEPLQTKTEVIRGRHYLIYGERHAALLYVGAIDRSELSSWDELFWTSVVGTFAMLLLMFFAIYYLIDRIVVKSVYRINDSLQKITAGDLDEKVQVEAAKEITDLSNGVNTTVGSLKRAIEEVKYKSEEELALAQRIQAAALPDLDKRYAHKKEFEVFGINRPMHKVGGDMYDFFFVSDNEVVFYVADVSGHGIPAALFMMKTMTLFKNLALSGNSLREAVERTNKYLSEDQTGMFVTGFFCRLDLTTGRMTYVNAGHNPPLLRERGGVYAAIKPEINLILAVNKDEVYTSSELQLAPGDAFMLYTDGITEATAPEMDCFELKRTLATLNAFSADQHVKETVNLLFDAVDRFTGYAEPSDDETILLFKFLEFKSK